MASFEICYQWMMDNEDAARAYKSVPDVGGFVISGINSAVFPEAYAYINGLRFDSRGSAVSDFYLDHFWNKWYEQLASDEIAKRVFDAAVNMGPGTAVKLLQQSTIDAWVDTHSITPAPQMEIDGKWGPITVAIANDIQEGALVVQLQANRSQHYEMIAENDPTKAQFLPAWLARATK